MLAKLRFIERFAFPPLLALLVFFAFALAAHEREWIRAPLVWLAFALAAPTLIGGLARPILAVRKLWKEPS